MKPRPAEVLGHTIPEPRITAKALWLIFVWVVLPVTVLGALADLFVQLVFGVCTGLWCFV